ncbi:histidine phosphatase family protein [Neorhodopirellula pilleata]|uniref:Phosphoserine phosphatase 1 n=1 Tax=Neorhodopirellula pilleata TaxID=2714738 RepID=A0A5C6AH41_9BACT|nr:histidine phosphatase family protein [Neorhodopirellula pilleata]TWT98757.1 Phosphoserine phosphatase 1 [Neorhodopirellula pilleata]
MTLRLFFMRHGETEWSLSGQHTGRADIPLTANGEDEARRLGERLRVYAFNHVLSSPLQRSWRTCELAGLSQDTKVEQDLIEWDDGDYEGRTSAEIHATRPEWNVFRDGCLGGEMPDEISTRADRLIERLTKLDGNVALFSHSHFGRVLAVRWIGLAVEHAQSLLLSTASLSILGYEHDRPTIVLWNSAPLSQFVETDP